MADLTRTLVAAASADESTRKQAEQFLKEWEGRNLPELATALATELATEAKPEIARQLSGLCLKNLLVAKDDALQVAKHEAWKNIDPGVRGSIKHNLLNALQSGESSVRSAAAQACSEVAAVELPYNEWPEFLSCLLEYVTSDKHSEEVKVASLQCLGFTCERIGLLEGLPDISADTMDRMLTTIVDGIRSSRPDSIRLAAAIALRNSLLFTGKNMENKEERDTIMQTICEATQSQNSRVRTAAYECVVQIASQYYDKLGDYMQTLFELTFATIKNDEEPVAKQAMEFWCTLCEVEMELIDEAAECAERGLQESRPCVRYAAAAFEHLGPLLTETLTKQDEEADLDDGIYNISMAAANCLSLLAQTVEDLVVPVIMPFVHQNIQHENWRLREAATMAFASILDGTSPEIIGPFVNQSIPVLLSALSDRHVMVKDTTAFAIAKICDLHVRAIPNETFPTLVNGLMSKLMTETPRVSSQACCAIHNLAAAFAGDESAAATGTNALSTYMSTLLQTLLQVADRDDADESNLRVSAYEAISVLIQYSAPDCQPLLLRLLPASVERLQHSLYLPVLTNDDRETKEGIQGLLCGLIQVLCQKLPKESVVPMADAIMTNLLQLLQVKNAKCHEEAFSAVGAIADTLEADFEKYMGALQPFLLIGIRNFEAFRVCSVTVGVVGDISRAIEARIQPYCDDIMNALVEALKDTTLHRSVKPPVLCCFGDIALAIGASFEPYLQFALMLLMQASSTRAPDDDEDLIEYVNLLRESILEAYTGIIQGLRDGNRVDLFIPYASSAMQFLQQLAADPHRDEFVLGKAVGLVGDIASTVGPSIRDQINQPFVAQLLRDGQESGCDSIMDTSAWASGVVQKLVQST